MIATRGEFLAGGVLADIFRRLGLLEQQRQAPNEALVPNTYTVDPDGNVVLTGIDLPAGDDLSPPAKDKVRWIRQSDGAVVADVFGAWTGGQREARVTAHSSDTETAEAVLWAINDSNPLGITAEAQLACQCPATSGGGPPSIVALTTSAFRTLLRDDGGSDYLQINNGNDRHSAAGVATLVWPGGSPFSNITNVSLAGATGNVFAVAGCDGIAGTTDAVVLNAHPVGNGTVDLRGKTAGGGSPAAAASVTVHYLLWGS